MPEPIMLNPFTGQPAYSETDEEREKALSVQTNPFTGEDNDPSEVINPFVSEKTDFNPDNLSESVHNRTVKERAIQAGLQEQIGFDAPKGAFTGILDILSRGQFGAAKLVDGLMFSDSVADIGAALVGSFKEVIAPEERLSFGDLILVHRAERASVLGETLTRPDHITARTLGFVLDVALDPTTYLTFGVGGALKITSKSIKGLSYSGKALAKLHGSAKGLRAGQIALSKRGKDVLRAAIQDNTRLGLSVNEAREVTEEAFGAIFSRDVLGLTDTSVKDFKSIISALDSIPAGAESILKHGPAVDLFHPGGINWAGKNIISAEKLSQFTEITGLRRLNDAFKRIPNVQRVMQLPLVGRDRIIELNSNLIKGENGLASFRSLGVSQANKIARKFLSVERLEKSAVEDVARVAGISRKEAGFAKEWADRQIGNKHEYIRLRKQFENEKIALERQVLVETKGLFGNLNKDQRTSIGAALAKARDFVKLAREDPSQFEDVLGKGRVVHITPKRAQKLLNAAIDDVGLDDPSLAALARMRQIFKEMGELEQKAGSLGHLQLNYLPARYSVINIQKRFLTFRQTWLKSNGQFTPEFAKKYSDDFAAIADGFEPVHDAAMLYQLRVLESKTKFSEDVFKSNMLSIFDVKNVDALPVEIRKDFLDVGDSLYRAGGEPEVEKLKSAYDGFLRVFRASATILRPGFAARQVISNQLQSFAVLGAKVMGNFSPFAMHDALLFVSGRGNQVREITTALGETIGGKALEKELFEGVIRNVTVEAQGRVRGVGGAKKLADEIDLEILGRKFAKAPGASEGMFQFIVGASRYTDWASHVEDFSRVSTYISARKIGHSAEASRELVDKALFDYLHGLSQTEKAYHRRIVPFYTFNRFAIPLIAETTAKTPGRATAMYKAGHAFYQVWNKIKSNETLTDNERRLIPGFILEQPSAFSHIEKETQKAVFNTFNNFSFLDVMGFFESGENGELDVERVAQKAGLAQLSPLIKLPFEVFARKNFFTGGKFPAELDASNKRKGDLNEDVLLTLLAGAVGAAVSRGSKIGATTGGLGGAAIGAVLGQLPNEPIQEFLKKVLSWEEGVNPKTGKREVYVNPFIYHVASGVYPVLNEVFKASNDHNTPTERVMSGLFGIGTTKVDLADQRSQKARAYQAEVRGLVFEARKARKEGRVNSYSLRLEELHEFVAQMEMEFKLMDTHAIRPLPDRRFNTLQVRGQRLNPDGQLIEPELNPERELNPSKEIPQRTFLQN